MGMQVNGNVNKGEEMNEGNYATDKATEYRDYGELTVKGSRLPVQEQSEMLKMLHANISQLNEKLSRVLSPEPNLATTDLAQDKPYGSPLFVDLTENNVSLSYAIERLRVIDSRIEC